jgi:hypothetical protein
MAYIVRNKTKETIWLRDGAWNSGEIDVNGERKIVADHDANVTVFNGGEHGNQELGKVWIPQNGSIDVHGKWSWDIR